VPSQVKHRKCEFSVDASSPSFSVVHFFHTRSRSWPVRNSQAGQGRGGGVEVRKDCPASGRPWPYLAVHRERKARGEGARKAGVAGMQWWAVSWGQWPRRWPKEGVVVYFNYCSQYASLNRGMRKCYRFSRYAFLPSAVPEPDTMAPIGLAIDNLNNSTPKGGL